MGSQWSQWGPKGLVSGQGKPRLDSGRSSRPRACPRQASSQGHLEFPGPQTGELPLGSQARGNLELPRQLLCSDTGEQAPGPHVHGRHASSACLGQHRVGAPLVGGSMVPQSPLDAPHRRTAPPAGEEWTCVPRHTSQGPTPPFLLPDLLDTPAHPNMYVLERVQHRVPEEALRVSAAAQPRGPRHQGPVSPQPPPPSARPRRPALLGLRAPACLWC